MKSLSKVHTHGMAASTFDREDTAVAANDSMEDFSNISVATLKKGMIVFVKKRPCKIISIDVSQPGKHGHAKARCEGMDIFTGKKYIGINPSYRPRIMSETFSMTDEEDGALSAMANNGAMNYSLNLPNEKKLAERIKQAFASSNEDEVDVMLVVTKCKAHEGDEHPIEEITSYKLQPW